MGLSDTDLENYDRVRAGGSGFIELPRGLVAVWGKEAVQFLDGMITNDMKTLADGDQMLAAFPNAQGRLLAVVRVLRQGERFLIETEEATREKLFQNLFRFTFAGDFFVEDLSDSYVYFEAFCASAEVFGADVSEKFPGVIAYRSPAGASYFVPQEDAGRFRGFLGEKESVRISAELYETLRIEAGSPKYGVDMDENTIVPELGLSGMISYTKGCYVGQEIIARIHFRGHVAKRLTGIVAERRAAGFLPGSELNTEGGKNAGRITSPTYSPTLDKDIAIAYVRYDHLADGIELGYGDTACRVHGLPFIRPEPA